MSFHWDEAAVERLKTEWQEGKSYSQLAAVFGCTRSAISGKIDRMRAGGWKKTRPYRKPNGPTPLTVKKAIVRDRTVEVVKPKPSRPQKGDKAAALEMAFASPPEDAIALIDVLPDECRCPYGNPRDLADFRFCGHRVSEGSYCAVHAMLVYRRAAA